MGAENLERKRWIIAAGAVVMQLCLGTVCCPGLYLETAHDLSRLVRDRDTGHIYDINGCHRHFSGLRRLFSR